MALINCPECGKKISNMSIACPHCGLPSSYYAITDSTRSKETENLINQLGNSSINMHEAPEEDPLRTFDYSEFKNALISFDKDYNQIINTDKYISAKESNHFYGLYKKYFDAIANPLITQYIKTNTSALRIDDIQAERFLSKMQHFSKSVEIHNENYINRKLIEYEDYFDKLLLDIDPNIRLDDEQRRAVLTDDNHCLLVAGAGAGKNLYFSFLCF